MKKVTMSANHAINFCARSIAKKAVIEQLRDQGVRVTLVKTAEIAERAKVYLEEHPEVYQQALERARRLGFLPIMITPDRLGADIKRNAQKQSEPTSTISAVRNSCTK